MGRSIQFLKAALALAVILAFTCGVPWALVHFIGNPIPDGGWDTISLGGADALLGVLAVIAWAGWAQMVLAFIIETISIVSDRDVRRGRTPIVLGGQQAIARRLVGVIAIAVIGGSSMATTATAATSATSGGTASAATPATEESSDQTAHGPRLTVQRGDSLWSLAERHLGSGERWHEIRALNEGHRMLDGSVFRAANHLTPGWRLFMPNDAVDVDDENDGPGLGRPPVQTAPTTRSPVRVEHGDTLSSIARQHLGDEERWPEIMRMNRDRPQPAGETLQDPDALRAGWLLHLPPRQNTSGSPNTDISHVQTLGGAADQHAAKHQQDRGQREGAAGGDQGAELEPLTLHTHKEVDIDGAARGAGTGGASATAIQTHGDQATPEADATGGTLTDSDETSDVQPWVAPIGIGAVLAAGVVGFVAGRRSTQQRHRRPGERIAMPAQEAAGVEVDLRAIADPIAVADVDVALRKLAQQCDRNQVGLPRIRMARLNADRFELHLAEPTTPVLEPFETAGDLLWAIGRDTIANLRKEAVGLSETYQAPYPALVSLGASKDGQGLVMVDLEEAGALGVCGAPELTREVLAALVLELAMSRWADDLRLTVVGDFADLAEEMDTGRIVHSHIDRVLRQLQGRIDGDAGMLADAGFDDVTQARIDPDAADLWAPHIIMVLGDIDPQQRAELAELVEQTPRAAYAVVTENDRLTDWTIQLTGSPTDQGSGLDATLEPDGLALDAQHMTAEVYQAALELAAVSTPPASPEPQPDEIGIDELEMIASIDETDTTTPDVDPEDSGQQEDSRVSSVSADTTETDETGVAEPAGAVDDDAPAQPADAASDPAPVIRVLGSPEIDGARGTVRQSQRNKLTDVAAYLVLNPGRGPGDWSDALDVTNPDKSPSARKNYRTTRMSYLRTWLGENAAGEHYLPKLTPDAGYRLHDEVDCDWAQFQDLLGDDLATASTADLTAALRLVRGRPFGAYSEGMFAWSAPLAEEMLSTIIDAVEEYARRRLLENRWEKAEWALTVGLACAPEREHLHRMRIRVAYASGDGHRTQEAIARLLTIRDSFDGELEDESMALLREIRQRPARRDVANSTS